MPVPASPFHECRYNLSNCNLKIPCQSPCDEHSLWNVSVYGLLTGNLVGTIPWGGVNPLNMCSSLGFNQLTGGIPSSIGSFTMLNFLDLGFNNFSGSLPSSLGNLSNLQYLTLENNQLTGGIPSSIGSLPMLYDLLLDSNYLSGPLPFCANGLPFASDFQYGRNCLSTSATCPLKEAQRSPVDCLAQCNATQVLGSCGGHGACISGTAGKLQCICDSGYKTSLQAPFTCTFGPACAKGSGFYGPNCTACGCAFGAPCDDGTAGTGCQCPPFTSGSQCATCFPNRSPLYGCKKGRPNVARAPLLLPTELNHLDFNSPRVSTRCNFDTGRRGPRLLIPLDESDCISFMEAEELPRCEV